MPTDRFRQELLRSTAETIGRSDGRYRGFDVDPGSETATTDPSAEAFLTPYTVALNHYLRDELRCEAASKYEVLDPAISLRWQWTATEYSSPTAVSVGDDLRNTMTANPSLKVFSANGLYDLTSPFFAAEYTFNHLGLHPALQKQIQYGYYPAGHIVYLNPIARAALKADLRTFYSGGKAGQP